MRLAKKVAAVALAAVMAVSMLTACGGGGGGTSGNNPGNTPGGGNTGTVTPGGGGSGAGDSGTTPGGGSTDNPGTDVPGEDDSKKDTIEFNKSRTGKFYAKLAPGKYTSEIKVTATTEGGQTGTVPMLISTDGKKIYLRMTQDDGQVIIVLKDSQNGYLVMPDEEAKKMDPPKDGFYYKVPLDDTSMGGDVVGGTEPIDNVTFQKETQGTYYIESQTIDGEKLAYWYDRSNSIPKYVVVTETASGKEVYRVEFVSIDFKEDSSLLDFDGILANYYNKTGQIPQSEVQTFKIPSNPIKRSAKRPVVW